MQEQLMKIIYEIFSWTLFGFRFNANYMKYYLFLISLINNGVTGKGEEFRSAGITSCS